MLLFMFKNRTICTDSDDIFRFLVYIYCTWLMRKMWLVYSWTLWMHHFSTMMNISFNYWFVLFRGQLKISTNKRTGVFLQNWQKASNGKDISLWKSFSPGKKSVIKFVSFFEKKFKFLSQGFFLHHMTQLLGA